VHRLEAQRLEDEEVERAGDDVGVGLVHAVLRAEGAFARYTAVLLIVKM
jgi:hypothetical protein